MAFVVTDMNQQQFPGLTTTSSLPIRKGNETVAPRRRRNHGGEQLKMFMTPEELMKLPSGDATDAEMRQGHRMTEQERRDFWSTKRGNAVLTDAGPYGNGQENLSNSIRRQGVQRPVDLEHGAYPYRPDLGTDPTLMVNGHHRVAVAAAVRPGQLIPVMHHSAEDDSEGVLPVWAEKVPRAMGWRDNR